MRHQSSFSPSRLHSIVLSVAIFAALSASSADAAVQAEVSATASIVDFGAVGDDRTINTTAIQRNIDALAAKGGGTVRVAAGTFVSGALFFKPGVNLQLDQGAVLKCSGNVTTDFPAQRTRIEGHFEDNFTPALINADGCDGMRITGAGTLDGGGKPIWDQFWKLRKAAPNAKNFPNLSVPRARLALIENSKNVTIEGVTFKDSQFWNLHLYRCQDVAVINTRFVVPDDYKQAPSTDGIDVDSSQRVTIKNCYFSVTDDCIALKGSKGPLALEDKSSPAVENVRVEDCTFKRGSGLITLGSEATVVRNVVVERCKVIGNVPVAVLKLRPDTPQLYEDIHIHDITLESSGGKILSISPWLQYADLKGHQPPQSVVRNVTLSNVRGRTGSFGTIRPNRGQTKISGITLENIDVQLKDGQWAIPNDVDMILKNVVVNGIACMAP